MQSDTKRKTLLCPGCGARILKVTECVDLTVECFSCGAAVSATVSRDGEMAIDYKPSSREAFFVTGSGLK